MASIRDFLNSTEELVHRALDRSVLRIPPHININDNGAGKRKKGRDDGPEINRPRRIAKGPLETYPCCDCSKWGKCSPLRPNGGCPCVVAERPCVTNCRDGCLHACQNQPFSAAHTRPDAPETEQPTETTVRTSASRRELPRRSCRRRASTGVEPAGSFVLSAPTDDTQTHGAPPASTGDPPAATTTATGGSITNPPTTTAGGGGRR